MQSLNYFILFLTFNFAIETKIDYFIDKDCRIFVSAANHVFLGIKNDELVVQSKYQDISGFFTTFKIHNDSPGYSITTMDKKVCESSGDLVLCDEGSRFLFEERVFGYLIKKDGRCVSVSEGGGVKMLSCTESDDQLFDLKLTSSDQNCDKKTENGGNKKQSVYISLDSLNGYEELPYFHRSSHHGHYNSHYNGHYNDRYNAQNGNMRNENREINREIREYLLK